VVDSTDQQTRRTDMLMIIARAAIIAGIMLQFVGWAINERRASCIIRAEDTANVS